MTVRPDPGHAASAGPTWTRSVSEGAAHSDEREHSPFASEQAASGPFQMVARERSILLLLTETLDLADGVGSFIVERDHPLGEGLAGGIRSRAVPSG